MAEEITKRFPANLAQMYGDNLKNIIYFTPMEFNPQIERDSNFISNSFVTKGSIALELPDEINFPDEHSYESGDSYIGFNGISEFGSRVWKNVVRKTLDVSSTKLVGLDTSAGQRSLEFDSGRTWVNPHTLLVYSNSGIRDLTFNFTFRPQSLEESETLGNIIKSFQWHSRSTTQVSGLKFPHVWKIYTSSKHLNYLFDMQDGSVSNSENSSKKYPYETPKIPFVCTSINPTFHTGLLYHNEYPSQIDILLTMSEIKPKYNI